MSGGLGNLNIDLSLNSIRFSEGISRAEKQAKIFAEATKRSLSSVEKSLSALEKSTNWTNRFLYVGQIKSGISEFLKLADSYTEIHNRMKLVSSSAVESAKAMDTVFDVSLKTRQGLNGTAQVYQRFAQNADRLGISQQQVASLTETVSKAVALSGASAASAEASLTQFGQSLAAGVFRGDEFNSVMEQTPGLALAIANGLGVTIGQLREMAAKGKLTMDVIIPALEKVKNEIDKNFDGLTITLGQAFENLNTSAIKWVGELNQSIGITDKLSNAVLGVSNHFSEIVNYAGEFVGVLAGLKISNIILPALHNKAIDITSKQRALELEQRLIIAERERAQSLVATTQATLQQSTIEYQAMKLRVENLEIAKQQTLAERELIAVQLQSANGSERMALLKSFNELKAQEEQINKMLSLSEKELLASKQALKVAYAENAIVQSTANAGLVKSNTLMTVYKGIVRATTAELNLMKAAFLANPILNSALILGVLSSFAGYWFSTANATEEATQKALEYAKGVDASREALEKLGPANLKKQINDLENSKAAQIDKINKIKEKIAELNDRIKLLNEVKITYNVNSWYDTKSTAEELKNIQAELVEKNADLETSDKDLDEITKKLTSSQERYNEVMGVGIDKHPDLTDKTIIFSGSLDDLGIAADTAKDKLQKLFSTLFGQGASFFQEGDKVVAYVTDKLQSDLNDLAYRKDVAGLKGKARYTKEGAHSAEQKGYTGKAAEKYIQSYVEAKLAEDKFHKSHKSKGHGHKENQREHWLNFYDEINKKSGSSLNEISVEEAKMFRRLEEYQKKGVVSHQEYENAKLEITNRFAKERLELSGKYSPEKLLIANLKDELAIIQELQKAGQLTQSEAVKAAQQLQFNHAQQISQNAITPMEQVKAIYDPTQEIANQQAQELAQLESFHAQKLLSEEEYQRNKKAIIDRYQNDSFQKEMEQYSSGLNTLGGAFSSMASMFEQSAGKQSSTYKALFAVSKAFAIAESTVKLSQAIAQAMASPDSITPAEKFANMAAVAAAGMNVINQITSVGFATGGYTGDGGKYSPAGIVHRGEYVITKEATSRLGRGFLDHLNYGTRGFANGGGVAVPTVPAISWKPQRNNNIVVKVINQGEPMQADVSQRQNGNQLEITVELIKKIANQQFQEHYTTQMRNRRLNGNI